MPLLPSVVFGSSYYPPHHDPADWPRDLDRMVESGLTVIRTGELLASWDRLEIAKHRYNFAWLDRIFDLAEERAMSILLGTGSCCPPIWMIEEYEDLQVVGRDGVPYPTATMWGWACKDHPRYLIELDRWVRLLAERYGARNGLLGWQIDNEPGFPFIPWRRDTMDLYCYCANTENAWREWLQHRYGDLEALSDAWRWDPTHHRYSSWAQVRAPRSTPAEWGVMTAWLDWRTFAAERLTDFVGTQAHLLGELTPDKPTSTNVFIWSRHDPFGVWMGQDPWRLAGVVDAIGFDLYPGIGKRFLHEPEYVGMFLDYARSAAAAAKAEFWLPEVESGPLNGWVLGPDHATTAADVTRINADGLGAGARLLLYQGYREWNCIPIHWGALVDMHGEPTPRLAAAAEIAGTEHPLDGECDPPDVALLVDFTNAAACQGTAAGEVLLDCIAGAYRGLHGFEVGFLSPLELANTQARLVVVPFGVLISEETGQSLTAYVQRGGHLVTFAKVGMLDGRGWSWDSRPGAGLDALLGVRESTIDTVEGSVTLSNSLAGAHHVQHFDVVDADVVATYEDGSPALTTRQYGDGLAYACGTHLDLGELRYGGNTWWFRQVARNAGARPLWSPHQPRVWVRRRGPLTTVTSTDPVERVVTLHLPEGDREVAVPAMGSLLLSSQPG